MNPLHHGTPARRGSRRQRPAVAWVVIPGTSGPDDARARVAVKATSPSLHAAAEALAAKLGLRCVVKGDEPVEAWLELGEEGLSLRAAGGPAVTVTPRAAVRRPPGGRDLLRRAVGRVPPDAWVADATAGLGVDAFHLASHGLRVVLIERSPLAAALLEDGLERARSGREGPDARRAAERMRLLQGDARRLLPELEPAPEVVVLDPMYPRSGKRARPGKGMALFRELVGEDADAAGLLEVARAVALRRVAVKRPLRAPPLGADAGGAAPSGSVVGTTTRFDLYAGRGRTT